MSQDRWAKIEETFHAALELPVQERSAFLNTACADDPEVRREVEALLNESTNTGTFLESPIGGISVASLNPLSLEGRSLKHYVIGPLIGSGGMAEVYRARDTKLGRDVAIKILHEVGFVDKERLETVYREARVLAALNHPNIASIYGIEEDAGLCGLVLELVEGETLSDRLRRGPLAVADALHLARQIIAGLGAAHARGIIHRDLKPSNIKLTLQGTVKLVDFGIAKLMRSLDLDESLPDVSRVGVVVGTVAYMSPEQARGKSIDVRSDVWAFGCVLYEMLTGRAAFRGDSPTDIIVKIASEEPDWTSIGTIVHANSTDIHRLIRKCIQKDPNMRYASVGEVAGYLEAVGSESLVSALPPPQSVPSKPAEPEFTLPRGPALPLFMLTQVGYLALYAATLVQFANVARILNFDFDVPEIYALAGPAVLAMCGIAIRIYLISAVGWRHPLAGEKFTTLFPLLLIFDGIWAASPLLIWHSMDNFGLAFGGVALLAYVPFAQRTLMHAIYPGRKTS